MRNKKSVILIVAILIITFNLWIMSKNDPGIFRQQPLRFASQIAALIGIIMMSLTLLLTTRFKKIENILGGLDSVYYLHQIAGSVSFVLIVNHPLLLALQALPNPASAKMYLIPGIDLSYNLGIMALYIMILSFIFMVFVKLPYHQWKFTHKFLGLTFLLAAIHSLTVASDISSYWPLKIWVGFFLVIGLASSIYSIFLFKYMGPKFLYEITGIERVLDVVNIHFKPLTKRHMKFIPGQFVYIEFANKDVGPETHPFSISSAPKEQIMRVSAKILGDYTLKLAHLKTGDRAFIYGPYGAFNNSLPNTRTVWIAGGIGVTPFLSKLRSELQEKYYQSIDFYYSYKTPVEGIFDREIGEVVRQLPHCRYFNWCSQEKKRLTAEIINREIPIDKVDTVFCCGPQIMMNELKKQFIKLGLPENKFISENFSFLP